MEIRLDERRYDCLITDLRNLYVIGDSINYGYAPPPKAPTISKSGSMHENRDKLR